MGARGVGVVLVNLGTPQEPTTPAVRRYLREFLSDPRIAPLPPLLWRPILEAVVLPRRAPASAAKYASVWTPAGSPLLVHTMAQVAALGERLGGVRVAAAMRYGEPGLAGVLDALMADGVRRILIVPMYPQFSTTTVSSVQDCVEQYLQARADRPQCRIADSWPANRTYIEACARRIEDAWASHGRPDFGAGDALLLSFHGIPVAAVDAGDPYPSECATTTRLLRERLGLDEAACPMAYQSKFGRAAWLTPATIDTVAERARAGGRRLDVFCPGFVSDCLETEEEIGRLCRDEFAANGGVDFVRIPSLNDSGPWLDALKSLVRRNLVGWVD